MKLPQLSLRDLFWLVLVAAMGLGWWLRDGKLKAEIEQLSDQLKSNEWRQRAVKLADYIRSANGTVEWERGSISVDGCAGKYLEVWGEEPPLTLVDDEGH
jgi:hypothetical protein